MNELMTSRAPTFIDLFSGCGGLSLGLSMAGWKGLFAVERATDAFATFQANFLSETSRHSFDWPAWLEVGAHSIDNLIATHARELRSLRGTVDLIAGGPPCQGFSFAGKRNARDPRNRLFERYAEFVDLVRPKALVLENVPGMGVLHQAKGQYRKRAFLDQLIEALKEIGYVAEPRVLNAAEFGVPQRRSRLVVVGVHKKSGLDVEAIFALLEDERRRAIPTSAEMALSDLSESNLRLIDNNESGDRGKFQRVAYEGPKTAYQLLMNCGVQSESMDSMRLPKHKPVVKKRFAKILRTCTRGVNLTAAQRAKLGMQKIRQIPMDGATPAPTLTTLPDDIIHYARPRILSVRECARLQSFPDWFVFRGKYTTGGLRRRLECPRYTQVGNAVPPLLARSLGAALMTHLSTTPQACHDTTALVRPEQAAAA